MKKLIIILFTALLAESVNAQTDSATMKRLGLLDDSKAELIIKCRRHIADAVINGDRQKVAELYEYALTLEDDRYVPLMPNEKWILSVYVYDFKNFTQDAVAFDSVADSKLVGKSMFNDNMYSVIYRNVAQNPDLNAAIESSSDLNQMEKDFVRLYLTKVNTQPVDQKEINKKCDVFLKQHPDSPFEYFIRNYIRYVYVKDFEKFQLDMGLGMGTAVLAGGITDWFQSGRWGFDSDIAIGLKNYEFQIRVSAMIIRSRKDVDFDDVVWEKGKGDIGQIQFNIGRYMPLTDKWVAIPRVGVGFTVIEPFYNKDDKDGKDPLKGKHLISMPLPTLGAEIRYEKIFSGGYDIGYICPVLRYSLQPVLVKINGEKTFGVMNSITAVFKFGAGFPKRKI
ncbi:MAG: hypothetical protein J6X32_06615 [Salinivirgaceae bacterium]|nr:hypothetical protein [Salinivirgaceae bacterium]